MAERGVGPYMGTFAIRRVLLVAIQQSEEEISYLDSQENVDFSELMRAVDQLEILKKAFEKGGDADVSVEFFFYPG
tara:strand:+ start:256 stop:483 length:228 start_codon:yes stop_codon:yes gene_type:complete